jgi:hypothetical protein
VGSIPITRSNNIDFKNYSATCGGDKNYEGFPKGGSFHPWVIAGDSFPVHDDYLKTVLQNIAHIAQSVEHFLGKEEVTGSNPVVGSRTRYYL